MKRILVSLWLGGAAIYTINTLILTGGLSQISEGPRLQSSQRSEAKTPTKFPAHGASSYRRGGKSPRALFAR